MNAAERLKTLGFMIAATLSVVVAAVVLNWATLWGWVTGRPVQAPLGAEAMVGQHLVEQFDPLKAASLEIVEYDPDTLTLRPFSVKQTEVKDGKRLWCIPSHDNYPADAEKHLAEAATSLMGLEVLSVASENPGDHELFGVVAPDPKTLKPGTSGVGTRVTVKDVAGKTLADLIIGKQVPDQPDLRYVRRVGEDPVYVVALDNSKLSTKFEDWIEEDLLKLNPWDIKQVWIRDYSVDELRGALIQRREMLLEYDDTGDPRWRLAKDARFDQGRWVPVEMAPDEELDTSRLDDMKYALDDLKIVDVRRKPEGLSADLRATGEFTKDPEAIDSLGQCGFYVATLNGQVELFSNEGEIRVLMKDGVEYILRFGEIAGGGEKQQEDQSGEQKESSAESSGMNRYLFVTAQFNPDAIPKPELKELPPEEPAEKQGESAGGAEGSQAAESGPGMGTENQDQSGSTSSSSGSATPAADEDSADQADTAPAEAGTAGKETAESGTSSADQTQSDKKSEAESERERIKRENERAQQEYEQKLEEGRKRVAELNARFADWYYIISDEVYQKIHLSREDIVKKKEKEEGSVEESHEQQGTEPEQVPEGQTTEQTSGQSGAEAAGGEQPSAEHPAGQPAAEGPSGGETSAADQPSAAQQPAPAGQPGQTQPEADQTGDKSGAAAGTQESAQPAAAHSGGQPPAGQPAPDTGPRKPDSAPGDTSASAESAVDVFERLKNAGPEGRQPGD